MARFRRLNAILQLVDKCDLLIDIGCDHGIFSKMALDTAKANKVIACDISSVSLLKAKSLLKNYSMVEFMECDGKQLALNAVDTIVISGMGGREILNIISGTKAKTLILQPQNFCEEVRRALNCMGYKIIADKVIFEGGKFYDCVKAIAGSQVLDDLQYAYGVFCKIYEPCLNQKLDLQYKKIMSYAKTKDNLKKLKIIEEVKKCQQ